MPRQKRPIPETRSITFKNVPTEYIDQLESLAGWFGTASKHEYMQTEITSDMSKAEIKTLFLCEMLHEAGDKLYGRKGAIQEKIERYIEGREAYNESLEL